MKKIKWLRGEGEERGIIIKSEGGKEERV